MSAHRVTKALGETIDRLLQALILERDDPAARLAEDVVVVMAARDDGLVSGSPLPRVHPLHQAHSIEQVEGAIDACDADPLTTASKLVRDLLRGEAAVLPREELDHRTAGPAEAMPAPLQRPVRPFPPVRSRGLSNARSGGLSHTHEDTEFLRLIIVIMRRRTRSRERLRMSPKWKIVALAAVLPSAALLTACGDEAESGDTQVVATTGILASIAGEVAGPDAEVA